MSKVLNQIYCIDFMLPFDFVCKQTLGTPCSLFLAVYDKEWVLLAVMSVFVFRYEAYLLYEVK